MIYLDSSALVKLAIVEPETTALSTWLGERTAEVRVSSDLARVEVLRAVLRRQPAALPQAQQVIARLLKLRMSRAVLSEAAALHPAQLRSLDAIHIASALRLGARLTSMVCYDERLGEAARTAGLAVDAPGT
ncbi:MAG: type II toxin-antitoxin system VapC family toxin [Geodermatophilaceae bacterium]|nr:type II toxin-antitoxin system VapC family toxin [Geodermatophilaceae bacterium]